MNILGGLNLADAIFESSDAPELNGSIRMDSIILNDEVYIFASAFWDDGVQVLKMGSDGQLTAVDHVSANDDVWVSDPAELDVVTVGNRLFLIVTSTQDDAVVSFEITTSGPDTGHLTHVENISPIDRADYAEAFYTSAGSFVAIAANDDSKVHIFQVSPSGNLTEVDSVVTTNGASDLSVHSIGSRTFLYVSSGNAAYEIAEDGTLTEVVGSLAPFGGEPIETLNVDGADLMVTANDDGVFGVFSLAADGMPTFLTSYDAKANDGLDSLRQFKIVNIEGATYILSVANYSTAAVFSLAADGTIELVQTIASDADLGFGFGIDYQEIGGRHYILYNAFDSDAVASIEIGGGDDDLTGTSGNDNIAGLAGDDTLTGDDGDDDLSGGIGDDILRPGLGNDTVDGGDGNDTVDYSDTGSVAVRLFGNRASGDEFRDTLTAVENIVGSAFDDLLNGDALANTISGQDGNDRLIGLSGEDMILGGAGNDIIRGGRDDDRLEGGDNDDRIQGELGNDILLGQDGEDVMFGGANNDILNGGDGDDRLTGGTHADVFVFETNGGFDRITDWQDGVDLVDLTDFGFSNFSEVEAIARQTGVGVRLEFAGGEVLQFADMALADLSADDFQLV